MKTLTKKLKELSPARRRAILRRAAKLRAIVRRAAARRMVDPRPGDVLLGYDDNGLFERAAAKVFRRRRRLMERLANLGGQFPMTTPPRRRRP